MPELPDIELYLRALRNRVLDARLEAIHLSSPFLLRSVEPPVEAVAGKRVASLRRIGKRIVLGLEDELFVVMHLMIAGRLRWKDRHARGGTGPTSRDGGARRPSRNPRTLAAIDFSSGTLEVTEASSKKRASLHLVRGAAALAAFDRGGAEPLDIDATAFAVILRRENHTLKRALTDPRLLSGIGNAYSDEILHAAGLSPLQLTANLDDAAIDRLHAAMQETLRGWTERLAAETGDAFPARVTAFRPGMAVHGRHGQPCPRCGTAVQRIVYAENECNYCARCQTGGRLLADRSLSRLLRQDWPRSIDELEERRRTHGRRGAGGDP
ncbi:MAG: DNA-formamidopyrimidine glycosylase family protein [Candidatus Eiseniibacteriota bacterium]|jgi:formamidopyrimidine-DNA glycosylase